MPKLVLTSNAVAYSLYDLLAAEGDLRGSGTLRGLCIELPDATFEAANAGATLKVGRPNAGLTDVTEPDKCMQEGDSDTWPSGGFISSKNLYLKGSVNSQIVYVAPVIH